MRITVIPILIILLATQAFSKWMVVLEFEINKEYIANNLCENRNKPVLKCGGKCQLSKKLVQEDSNSGNTSSYQVTFQELVFAEDAMAFCFTEFHKLKVSTFPSYLINPYPTPHFPIFHPPLS